MNNKHPCYIKNTPLQTPPLQAFITSFTTPTINLHRQRPLEKIDQTRNKKYEIEINAPKEKSENLMLKNDLLCNI